MLPPGTWYTGSEKVFKNWCYDVLYQCEKLSKTMLLTTEPFGH